MLLQRPFALLQFYLAQLKKQLLLQHLLIQVALAVIGILVPLEVVHLPLASVRLLVQRFAAPSDKIQEHIHL